MPNTIRENKVDLAKEMGCVAMSVGIESGDPDVRKKLMRHYNNEKLVDNLQMVINKEIRVSTFNIIGFPEETEEMIKTTVQLNRKLNMTSSGVNVFYPYKGTPLGDHCFDNDLVDLDKFNNFSNERRESSLKFSDEHHEMINKYYRNWDLLIYPVYTYTGLRHRYFTYRNIMLKKLGIFDFARDLYQSQKKWA